MKKILILILVVILSGCGGGVGGSYYTDGEGKILKREMEYRALGIVTDTETGCQYISQIDGGMTPRLNSDGTPYCKKVANE